MKTPIVSSIVLSLALSGAISPAAHGVTSTSPLGEEDEFTDTFMLEHLSFKTRGRNPFFPLVPGSRIVLQGVDDDELVRVQITTLHRTERVAGVWTRVVEEREWIDGELVEVSRNFFAHCRENGSVFYFGEDVDIYEDGEIVSHAGAWRAGRNGARAGCIMPGLVVHGSRYFQEVAPGVALDRAEHISLDEVVLTPRGKLHDCLFVEETSPLEPGSTSEKFYAPGIGLVQDNEAKLISFSPGDCDHDDDDDDDD